MDNIAHLSGTPLEEADDGGLGHALLVSKNPTNTQNNREIKYLDPADMTIGTANNSIQFQGKQLVFQSWNTEIGHTNYDTRILVSPELDSLDLESEYSIELTTKNDGYLGYVAYDNDNNNANRTNLCYDKATFPQAAFQAKNLCINCDPAASEAAFTSDLPVNLVNIPSDYVFSITTGSMMRIIDGQDVNGSDVPIRFIYNVLHRSSPWEDSIYAAIAYKSLSGLDIGLLSGSTSYTIIRICESYDPVLISIGKVASMGLGILLGTSTTPKTESGFTIRGKAEYQLGVYFKGTYADNVSPTIANWNSAISKVGTQGEWNNIKLIERAVYLCNRGIKTIDDLGFHSKSWSELMI